MEFKKITFLKIYTGEDVMLNDQPLYKAVIEEARRLKLAGGTVMKGIEGYATTSRGVGRAVSSFVSGNANYPIVVEIVDRRDQIEKILPFLEANIHDGLVLVEDSTYLETEYTRRRAQDRANWSE